MEKTFDPSPDREANPFLEPEMGLSPQPCLLVIFGASGDLTKRKLVPSLFNLMKDGNLPTNFACVGVARREKTDESFRTELAQDIKNFSRTKAYDSEISTFLKSVFYHRMEFHEDEGYKRLYLFLKQIDQNYGTLKNRIFYLSVQPAYFLLITEKLKKHAFMYSSQEKHTFSRIIIEKPFGHDYLSAISLQKSLLQFLTEKQIYRIDHYLGKETVQNLLVFRFSNSIFESLWNHRYVDNIQITVAESIGIEGRGPFYESQGLIRDIIQNHLMQLVSLVAMEPPINLTPDAIRDEKVKVLQSLRGCEGKNRETFAIRGQYTEGFIEGKEVVAYRNEPLVNPLSSVETFAAIRLQIENWRWAGTPIYIRAGKRLPKRSTEIVISFKKEPNILFHKNDKHNSQNQIIFRIQPNEGISIKFNAKIPPSPHLIQEVNMDFQYANYFGKKVPEAYERLIYDCIIGDNTLFARADESFYSWKFLTPILHYWLEKPLETEAFYPAGTWGPKKAIDLLKKENRNWKRV